MKVVRVDRYFTAGAVLMPDGTGAYCNIEDGDMTVRVLSSMLVAIPDTATTDDVDRLKGEYLDAVIDNGVGAEWQYLGEGDENRWELSLTADDPANADIHCVLDADGQLVIADEALRWLVAPWEPHKGQRDSNAFSAQLVERMLHPDDREDAEGRRYCVSILKPMRKLVVK